MKKKSTAKKRKKLDPLDSPQWISESSARSAAVAAAPPDDSGSGSGGGGTKVTISNIPRVPIYGNIAANIRKCTVTILPADITLRASLEIVQGVGSKGLAKFAQGGTSIDVRGTQELSIAGVENSDAKDNMRLIVKAGDKILAEKRFSVRTWPKQGAFNPRQIGKLVGGLLSNFRWVSESGTVQDLADIRVGEIVNYNPPLPSPPYGAQPPNPTILDFPGNKTEAGLPTVGWFQDIQNAPFFAKPYAVDDNTAIQDMGFWDPVLDGPKNAGNQHPLQQGIKIRRKIVKTPAGIFVYTVEKLNVESKPYDIPENP